MKIQKYLLLQLLFAFASLAYGQTTFQTVRGTVTEQGSGNPVFAAEITCLCNGTAQKTLTDSSGRFRLENIPVGRQSFIISKTGFTDRSFNNMDVSAGKELVLSVILEEKYESLDAAKITVKKTPREKPINDMATVSARQFSVEETQRYAAAVNDPARMAMGFAGVMSPDDGNNMIVIRGNAPNGLIWRMEGMDIPNPNHFSNVGTSGGGITILSAQLLSNSDFITGAFPAEYGNGLSGVFDLNLRKGNNEKREHTLQFGLLGLDLATEGPLGRKGGSYLVNYRYSTLSMISALGIELGDAVTKFQDLSYNIHLPLEKRIKLSFFGFAGLSDQNSKAFLDTNEWKVNPYRRYTWNFRANSIFNGAKIEWQAGKKHQVEFKTGMGITGNGADESIYDKNYNSRMRERQNFDQTRLTFNAQSQYKFSTRSRLRSGITVSHQYFDLSHEIEDSNQVLRSDLKNSGNTQVLQAYSQWQFRPVARLTLTPGIHALYLRLNNSYSVEPRMGIRYQITKKNWISGGFGMHSQVQPLGNYFYENKNGNTPNKNLKLTKATHYVIAFDQLLGNAWHFKTEAYWQQLRNLVVSPKTGSTYCQVNSLDGYYLDTLISTGKGKNYGVEITLEKFFSKQSYLLITSSLSDSRYTDAHGEEHSTRFNVGRTLSVLGGKEWNIRNNRLGVNLKLMWIGGMRDNPINIEASKNAGYTIRDYTRTYEWQNPDYVRMDTKIMYKINKKKHSITWSLDLQNSTNRANVWGSYYDNRTQKVAYSKQAPLIPILAYKIEF